MHRGAIDAGGKTIGIIGTPLEKSYPAKNRALQTKLMNEHLVLSQFGADSRVQPANFPMRNRAMALLSHAGVVIEAGEKSGVLSFPWEALRLGRPLFVLGRLMNDPALSWPKKLAHYGAIELRPEHPDVMSEFLPEHGSRFRQMDFS